MSDLANYLMKFRDDPLGFVLAVFPWGEQGTALADQEIDPLQAEILGDLRDAISDNNSKDVASAIRVAIAAGHGIGKSALTSWIILWFISTRYCPQIVVTAGTAAQLNTKTWRELAKWKRLAINGDWFDWTATKLAHKDAPETWFAVAQPWSEHNPDAFAGTHEKHVLIIFDEASSVADTIWETVEGAMTTEGCMWIAFGNPVRNSGRFRECFRKFRHRWKTYKIDSRRSSLTNKEEIKQWESDYGIDSDFFRVRVLGEFPKKDSSQFISVEEVTAAQNTKAEGYDHMPVLIGVDVALKHDKTVIAVRQGRRLHFLKKFRELNAVQVSYEIEQVFNSFRSPTLFIDGVGVGAGIVDFVRAKGIPVISVNAGLPADDARMYLNKRAEMWDRMRKWIREGAQIPKDDELLDDLTEIHSDFNDKGMLFMEKKSSMFARGLSSPDCADALSMTFYTNVAPHSFGNQPYVVPKFDWTPF